MKTLGIVSYNINCNFTNYGSALQSWALKTAVERLGYRPILVDYCPDVLKEANPLDPFKKMWDKDPESRRMCELTMPAIRENYVKFERFYTDRFNRTKRKYTSADFNDIVADENIDGFVCGSDTIFCIDEFGLDRGYYADYDVMRGRSVAYAPSFGDSHFTEESHRRLNTLLGNFKAIALRENDMIQHVRANFSGPVARVIDPTLLLTGVDYEPIVSCVVPNEPYLLLYARRYNRDMEEYAERLAAEKGLKIVEISLRATNANKGHEMRYDAGVEEFLGLVRGSEVVVTNSYHALIFSLHYNRQFVLFSREQCDTKIQELLDLCGGIDIHRFNDTQCFSMSDKYSWDAVADNIQSARYKSDEILRYELEIL